jgi:glycosyltransferase involved in cell wall biosynthesis
MNNNSTLVSVLITAFNREKYIAQAIESVLDSSFNDFELIIVDDGSKDNTVEIAKSYKQKDRRIKLYINEKNVGDYPNRNIAASYAKGKYLKYLDSDDTMSENCLSVMAEHMEKNTNVGLGVCVEKCESIKIYSSREAYLHHFNSNSGLLSNGPTAVIIRKSVFEETLGFLPYRNVSDTDLWLKIAAKHPIIEFPNMVKWRIHSEQEIQLAPEYYHKYSFALLKDVLYSSTCPLNKEESKKIILKEQKMVLKLLFKKYALRFKFVKFINLFYLNFIK